MVDIGAESGTNSENPLTQSIKKEATATASQGAWEKAFSKLDPDSEDPFLDLLKLSLNNNAITLDDRSVIELANEYDEIRQQAGFGQDPSIDHEKLIAFFLNSKGVLPETKRFKLPTLGLKSRSRSQNYPGTPMGRRAFLRGGLALAGLGTLAAVGATPVWMSSSEAKAPATPSTEPTASLPPTSVPTETTTPTRKPTLPPSPSPTEAPKVKLPETPYDELLRPLLEAVYKRREEKMKDPEYLKRIDPELNKDRINIVLSIVGETHEPPVTEHALITTDTIISINTKTGQIDTISWTHDTRSPEVEQEFKKKEGKDIGPIRIDQAFNVGGIPLLERVVENMTGLSADLVLSLEDHMIVEGVDQVFGKIGVDIPKDFRVYPYYLKGQKYPEDKFAKGHEEMAGRRVIQYIKTNPIGDEDVAINHNLRKKHVMSGMEKYAKGHFWDPSFWGKGKDFLKKALADKRAVGSIDPQVLTETMGSMESNMVKAGLAVATRRIPVPGLRSQTYLSDPARGDGGVQWVTASENPITKEDLRKGIYRDRAFKTPINGNPYSDNLVKDYWGSTRTLVKKQLNG
ncbi:LCP family protein [Candidatus Daviesbacteria bacterium]|nr:LCP family protein [Candidatus Daviesbacteria bacterium]